MLAGREIEQRLSGQHPASSSGQERFQFHSFKYSVPAFPTFRLTNFKTVRRHRYHTTTDNARMSEMTSEKEKHNSGEECRSLFKALNKRWTELCLQYLPVRFADSIWRYSRHAIANDAEQGWKLHVTATILTANEVLEKVAPLLQRENILFKAPASLRELSKINSGIYYGYSQIGKFITVYPQTKDEAARLARELHQLTKGGAAPAVPFEPTYRAGSCIYYRYGAFTFNEMEGTDGSRVLALRDPEGNFVPDRRGTADAKPEWVADLFPSRRAKRPPKASAQTPLKTTYRAFGALAQRGKGGVYQAVDFSVAPPRRCVLKEGRRHGEVGLDGRDGFRRIRHEEKVLLSLARAGVKVPRLYAAFKAEKNYYLALEYIEGDDLNSWLTRRKRRLEVSRALRIGVQLANLMARIHEAGWVWRDCKPANIIVTKTGELRPLDFEGACRVARPDPEPWGTPPFAPFKEPDDFGGQTRLPEDLYALGATMYLMLTGTTPDALNLLPLEFFRRSVPPAASALIMTLLDADPERRLKASTIAEKLKEVLSVI